MKLGSTNISKLYVGASEVDKIYLGATEVYAKLWTPADLGADLALWLDADDESTITLNGSNVAQWDDKSGNGNHATQETASAQPTYTASGLNNKPVITFDSKFFNHPLSLTGQSTIYTVVNKTATNRDQTVITISGVGVAVDNAIWAQITSSINQWGVFTNGFKGSGEAIGVDYRIVGTVSNTPPTGLIDMYTDGSLSGSEGGARWNGSDNLDRRRIGSENPASTRFLSGAIPEILVCNTPLSTTDRQRLEGYLAHKWGLDTNLPADHPYKTTPPTV